MATETADKHRPQWFVMRCYGNLFAMEDLLSRNNFQCFVPKKTEVRRFRNGERPITVPAVPPYIFVRAEYAVLDPFQKTLVNLLYAKRLFALHPEDHRSHTTMTVPDKEMDDFIRVATQQEQAVRIYSADAIELSKGQRVRICGGILNGVEGVLLKMKGLRDKRFVVTVPGIMSVTTPVDRTYVQLID